MTGNLNDSMSATTATAADGPEAAKTQEPDGSVPIALLFGARGKPMTKKDVDAVNRSLKSALGIKKPVPKAILQAMKTWTDAVKPGGSPFEAAAWHQHMTSIEAEVLEFFQRKEGSSVTTPSSRTGTASAAPEPPAITPSSRTELEKDQVPMTTAPTMAFTADDYAEVRRAGEKASRLLEEIGSFLSKQ